MQSNASRSQINIDTLFFMATMHKLNKLDRQWNRSAGRHIKGRVLKGRANQKRKGRKQYVLADRGGHW